MKLRDPVALIDDLPEKALRRGQVGVVAKLPGAGLFEVEFRDLEGRTYASAVLPESRLMVLHYEPASALA